MAIRPTDLQLSIVQAAQNPPVAQRAEEAPRQAQAAAQAAFIAQTSERNESIAATRDAQGNKVGERESERRQHEKRDRRPGDPFEDTPDEAAGISEPAHLIDVTV